MFMSLGLGHYSLALYHLANHACFKAMLFMAAGAVIHAFLDQQDLRRYGGLVGLMPYVYSALVVGSLSLMAVPYLTGWYSKDGILEVAVGSYTIPGGYVYTLGTTVAGLTAFYSVRLILMAFLTGPRSDYASYAGVHDASYIVIVPLGILSMLSIGLGFISSDLFRGLGSDFLGGGSPLTVSAATAQIDAEYGALTPLKLGPFAATVLGSLAAYWLYMTNHGLDTLARLVGAWLPQRLYRFMTAQWLFDAFIISGVIMPGLGLRTPPVKGTGPRPA
jgi:NADH-ubiquinone oxidoreductase chain 5